MIRYEPINNGRRTRMTISAQSLTTAERNKFNALRDGMSDAQKKAMDKKLAIIVQTAIKGAGEAESANITNRIALALKRAFPLG
jgi:hypothetical protein